MKRALRILLVDDDVVDRRICRRALGKLDPPPVFVEAENAAQALGELQRDTFDCMLLDFRLPDMDGLELLVQLNERSIEQRVPVIMLTGADDVSVAVEAMRQGAGNYVVKDVDGRYQELMPTIVQHALRDRELQLARWRDEQALAHYRDNLSDLAQRLMDTEKTTTRQLAQVLHDQLGQTLAAIRLGFDAVCANCASLSSEPARRHTTRVSALIDEAVREVRQVLVALRPPLLDGRGLLDALDNELRMQPLARDDVELQFEAAPGIEGMRWPRDVEYAAFMIAREAIGNALQHANATRVRVSIDGDERSLRLRVTDDGSGIPADLSRPGHLGIVGMRERALAIGARFALETTAGRGTAVLLDWSAP